MAALKVLHYSIEFCLDVIALARRAITPDLTETLVYAAAFDGNISHLDATTEMSRRWAAFDPDFPSKDRKPIRKARLADSLIIPRQTVQTKVSRLTAQGLLRTSAGGVVAQTDFLFAPAGRAHLRDHAELTARLIARIADDGLCGLEPGEGLVDPDGKAGWTSLRLAVHHGLQTLYSLRTALNGGSPMADYVLLSLFSETWVRDAPPRPISAANLAEQLTLPRETVRRHVARLIERGLVVRERGGYAIAPELPTAPAIAAAASGVKTSLRRVVRRLRDADAIGVRPTA